MNSRKENIYMSRKYLNMFPGDDLKGSMTNWGKKPLASSHKEGFTPQEDIVLKAGQPYKLTLWQGTTKNTGYPTVSLAVEEWQPFTGGSSNNAEGNTGTDDAPF
jgi:hypothetical protein